MDADELARITGTLVTAIAEAKTRAKESGIDPEFREIVRHAREMHDLLVEAMIANKAPSTVRRHRAEPLHTSLAAAHPSRMLFALKSPLLLYPFRYFDPVRKRWIRARYVAERHVIESSYAQWEIIGPPEIRSGVPVVMFSPWASLPPRPTAHLPPVEEPPPGKEPPEREPPDNEPPDPPVEEPPDQLERFLVLCCCFCGGTSHIAQGDDDSRRWKELRDCMGRSSRDRHRLLPFTSLFAPSPRTPASS
jgi:hypothetical protein